MLFARRAAGINIPPNKYEDIVNYADLRGVMQAMAYELQEEDPWLILGIPKFEGPLPSKDLIERRVRDGILMASMVK